MITNSTMLCPTLKNKRIGPILAARSPALSLDTRPGRWKLPQHPEKLSHHWTKWASLFWSCLLRTWRRKKRSWPIPSPHSWVTLVAALESWLVFPCWAHFFQPALMQKGLKFMLENLYSNTQFITSVAELFLVGFAMFWVVKNFNDFEDNKIRQERVGSSTEAGTSALERPFLTLCPNYMYLTAHHIDAFINIRKFELLARSNFLIKSFDYKG